MIQASLIAQLVKNCQQCKRPQFDSWVRKIPWRRHRLPVPVFLGFPGGSVSKESSCNVEELGSIPGLGRSPGGGHGNSVQYPFLENTHRLRNLVGYSPWDVKESDKTEQLTHTQLWEVSYEGLMPKVQLTTCNQKGTGIKILFSKEEIKSWTFLRNNRAGWLPSWSSG